MKTGCFFILFTFSYFSYGDVYSCTDKAGKKIFTDNKRMCINSLDVKSTKIPSDHFYDEVPDLLQTKSSAKFPGGGKQFCGPVAVSNSLVWLEGDRREAKQIDLVHRLSSAAYMNTNAATGTRTTGLIHGVEKYVNEVIGGYSKLEYSGWGKVPHKYRSALKKPTVTYMQSGLNRKGAVWLNVGWYKLNQLENEYRRIGGHWVTLVGYDNGRLVLHDPASRAGRAFSNEFVGYKTISSGMLVINRSGLSINASGFFILGEGMHIPSKADVAIVDGVVLLQL